MVEIMALEPDYVTLSNIHDTYFNRQDDIVFYLEYLNIKAHKKAYKITDIFKRTSFRHKIILRFKRVLARFSFKRFL